MPSRVLYPNARYKPASYAFAPVGGPVGLLEQVSFRGRVDNGNETTATWPERVGISWAQAAATAFRMRFTVRNRSQTTAETTGFQLQYSYNGGTWTNVSSASSVVRSVTSGNLAAGAATTAQLGRLSGSAFVAGTMATTATGSWPSLTLSANASTELEVGLDLVDADVVDGDEVRLRVARSSGTPLDKHRRFASLTVSENVPTVFLSDTFNRSASSGWGTADGGTDTVKAWTIVEGTAGDLSVNGSMAVNATGFGTCRLITGDARSDNIEILALYKDINNTDNSFRDVGPVFRWTNTTTAYGAVIRGDGAGNHLLYIINLGVAVFTSVGITYFQNAWMKVQCETVGADVVIRVRYWQDGAGEPGTWTLTHTHNSGTRRLSGRYGTYATNQSDTLDTKLDSFSVSAMAGALPTRHPALGDRRFYGVHHERIYFGVANEYYLDSFNRAQAAGSQISRHSFLWNVLEPSSGTFDWSRTDLALDMAEARGMGTIYTIIGSPTWASGRGGIFDIPTYLSGTWNSWLASFVSFITAAVTRYADRNVFWELWNEPNLQGFWNSTNSQTTGQNKPNWMDEYKTWHDAIRAAILAVDPHARIAAPTLSTWRYIGADNIDGETFLLGMISRSIVLDAVSFHLYDNDAPDNSVTTFENHHTDVALLRASLVSAQRDYCPIWFTEFGWDTPALVTAAVQATYLTTAFTMIRDNWPYVEAACWFMLEDTAAFPGNGLYLSAGNAYAPRASRDALAAFTAS